MPQYIAFLRAINVGGHTVKMECLRTLFESLAFTSVETFIASGNAIFQTTSRTASASLERKIERLLEEELGYEVPTFVRTPIEVATAAGLKVFRPSKNRKPEETLWIGFLKAPLGDEARARLLALQTKVDAFDVHGRELYWLRRRHLGESKITGAKLERALGGPTTMRNVTTVRKLSDRYHTKA
ncbi:MAG: DUF1697 domain-containing protein [Gemmatimonadaceae bacterium]